jgi:hypothetical protein
MKTSSLHGSDAFVEADRDSTSLRVSMRVCIGAVMGDELFISLDMLHVYCYIVHMKSVSASGSAPPDGKGRGPTQA